MSRPLPDGWNRVDRYAIQHESGHWRIAAAKPDGQNWTFILWKAYQGAYLWVDNFDSIEAAITASEEA